MLSMNQSFCFQCMAALEAADAICSHCGVNNKSVRNAPNQLQCGLILNQKYLIGKVLGQGGFGITYVGLDLNLQAKVAIKEFFPSDFASRDQSGGYSVQGLPGRKADLFNKNKQRFINEARVLAQFADEKSIVSVRDYFEENGTAYFVMDFVEGESLKHVLKEHGPFTYSQAVGLVIPIIDALEEVHKTNLIHRDIAPDNILVRPNGSTVLIDFGAARTASAKRTHSLSVVVKPGYAPPEQYYSRGEQGEWTDIYALCATLYKLITGKTPPPSLDRQAGQMKLVPPSSLGADITLRQEKVIMRGLSLEPRSRQQSMIEFKRDLNNCSAQKRGQKQNILMRDILQAVIARARSVSKAIWIAASSIIAVSALLLVIIPRLNAKLKNDTEARNESGFPLVDGSIPQSDESVNDASSPKLKNGAFTYEVLNNGVRITDYDVSFGNSVDIPNRIEDKPVVAIGDAAFYRYCSITDVTLPATLESIGDYAFEDCMGLNAIVIPDSVTSVGSEAFLNCSNLSDVRIPDSIKDVGAGAFFGTQWLKSHSSESFVTIGDNAVSIYVGSETSVTVPPGVRSVDFYANHLIQSVILPDSIQTIPACSFYGCDSLKSIEMTNHITHIGYSAFTGCSVLSEVNLPDDLVSIGDGAFSGCESLRTLTIPESVQSIGDDAFSACEALYDVQIPKTVNNIGISAFAFTPWLDSRSDDFTILGNNAIAIYTGNGTTATVPSEVRKFDFSYCSSIQSVTLPDSITTVPNYAFYSCDSLQEVNMPESLKEIGDRAFANCSSLKAFGIPAGVTSLGESPFEGCGAITTFSVAQGNNNYTDIDGVLYTSNQEILIHYPGAKEGISFEVPQSVKEIGSCAFDQCAKLETISIPASTSTIGYTAFSSCDNLAAIIVDETNSEFKTHEGMLLTKHGDVLVKCPPQRKEPITVPEGVAYIAPFAFTGCRITSLELPSSVVSILSSAFSNCGFITSITFPDALMIIAEAAFFNCVSLAKVTFGNGLKEIGRYAFNYCPLQTISVPSSVVSIDSNAFNSCDQLSSIEVDAMNQSYESIDGVVFTRGGETLLIYPYANRDVTYNIPDGVESIASEAFQGSWELTKVVLPASLQAIGKAAFMYSGITVISIPNSVSLIADDAFTYCHELERIDVDDDNPHYLDLDGVLYNSAGTELIHYPAKKVDISYSVPANVHTIKEEAFAGQSFLSSLTFPNSLKVIENSAFSGCLQLASIEVSRNVSYIGNSAFAYCNLLMSIRVSADNENYMSENDVLFSKDGHVLIQYPAGKLDREYIVPDGVERINSYAFSGCNTLISIVLSESVKCIDQYAFGGASALESIRIPASVTSIGSYAFDADNTIKIFAPVGSYAEKYANENGIAFSEI